MEKFLFVAPECIRGERAILDEETAHHVKTVMRLGVGALLLLADGSGRLFRGRISAMERRSVAVDIEQVSEAAPEARPRIVLMYGLAKGERSEWVIQKATELGVSTIVPIFCQRSVVRPTEHSSKQHRWEEIVRQAARQAERLRLPELRSAMRMSDALAHHDASGLALMAEFSDVGLSHWAPRIADERNCITILVGPEGGFTDEEVNQARGRGFAAVSLGPLVLRSETAAVAFLATIGYLSGRWAPEPRLASPR